MRERVEVREKGVCERERRGERRKERRKERREERGERREEVQRGEEVQERRCKIGRAHV